MSASVIWLAVVLLPLGFALLLGLCRGQQRLDGLIRSLWASSLPAFIALLIDPGNLGLPGLWPAAQWGLESGGLTANGDSKLNGGWLLFTAVLWTAAALYAGAMLKQDTNRRRFFIFWQLALAGNLLLVIAQDTLSFYVGFSLMSLSAYGLIVHLRSPQARRAGRLYLQLAISGEILLFSGIILLAHELDGITRFAALQAGAPSPLTSLLLFCGLGLKAGFWPLHVWLPQAHPVAPAPASAVLSGAMIKAGILGLWRFLPGQSEQAALLQDWAPMLLGMGFCSAFYGVALGLTRSTAKQVLAYSSVSQMGYLLIIIGLAWHSTQPSALLGLALLVYAAHHAYCKAALFLAADLVKGPPPASALLRQWLPIILVLPALALAALPLSSGAAAKLWLTEGMALLDLGRWTVWLSLGAFASTLLVLRVIVLLRADWQKTLAAHQSGAGVTLPWQQALPWMLLSVLPMGLPWLWDGMRQALLASLDLGKLLELLGPLLLGLGLMMLALRRQWRLPNWLKGLPDPVMAVSLMLKRWLQNPPLPAVAWRPSQQKWRHYERRWNRYWHGTTINHSTALLLLFLLSASLFLLLLAPTL